MKDSTYLIFLYYNQLIVEKYYSWSFIKIKEISRGMKKKKKIKIIHVDV